MSAKDFFHDHVREALDADGWTITDDPFVVRVGKKNLPIDLAAERLIAAERDAEKIAVEIKSFRSPSKINEFHTALGQYLNYRLNLSDAEPRELYLALPNFVNEELMEQALFQRAVDHFDLKLIIFDPTEKRIEQWRK